MVTAMRQHHVMDPNGVIRTTWSAGTTRCLCTVRIPNLALLLTYSSLDPSGSAVMHADVEHVHTALILDCRIAPRMSAAHSSRPQR